MTQTGSQSCGDLVGFQFNDEQQAVLFAPASGDVMVCAVTDWQDLLINPHASLSPALRAMDLFPG